MHTQLGGQGDTTDEEEKGIGEVERQCDHRVEVERFSGGGGYEVEERQEGEDRDEHGVIDG